MEKKGIGRYQKDLAWDSQKQILNVLSDGKWHRHQEIQQATKLSTATLSKHLKRLEKGLVEKKLDLESGQYPYPVYYRIRQTIPQGNLKTLRDTLIKGITSDENLWIKNPEWYIEFLSFMLGQQILENLSDYFHKFHFEEPKEAFEQEMEYLVFSIYRETIMFLAEKLKELSQTENLDVLLNNAKTEMAKDFDLIWKAKIEKFKPSLKRIIRKVLSRE